MPKVAWLLMITVAMLADHAPADDSAPRGVAVVELFTSEGCNSCPPADKLLGELVELADQKGFPIICIGWHVDYWDRLGWDDRFNSEAISNRQRAYAKAFGSNRIYTPQMIVNGTDEFTGSDRKQAAQSITTAFTQPATANVELTVTTPEPATLQVAYQVTGAKRGQHLTIVLVENEATTDVRRGENSGRTLTHVNAVREFRIVELSKSGEGDAKLPMPEGLSPTAAEIIAIVQDAKTMQVYGAAVERIVDPSAAK